MFKKRPSKGSSVRDIKEVSQAQRHLRVVDSDNSFDSEGDVNKDITFVSSVKNGVGSGRRGNQTENRSAMTCRSMHEVHRMAGVVFLYASYAEEVVA